MFYTNVGPTEVLTLFALSATVSVFVGFTNGVCANILTRKMVSRESKTNGLQGENEALCLIALLCSPNTPSINDYCLSCSSTYIRFTSLYTHTAPQPLEFSQGLSVLEIQNTHIHRHADINFTIVSREVYGITEMSCLPRARRTSSYVYTGVKLTDVEYSNTPLTLKQEPNFKKSITQTSLHFLEGLHVPLVTLQEKDAHLENTFKLIYNKLYN